MTSQRAHADEPSPAVLLLLDLPPKSLCGIDLISFTTSPTFKGIRHVPPGLHFVFTGRNASFSLRDGFWVNVPASRPFEPNPLSAYRWNPDLETLQQEPEPEVYRAEIAKIWESGLSPYRQDVKDEESAIRVRDWTAMTNHIRPHLLEHLSQSPNWRLDSASCAEEDRDEIPGVELAESEWVEHPLGTLGIDLKRSWKEGTIGRERTNAAKDKSWALQDIVTRRQRDNEAFGTVILGQMQACYIMILTLANYSCLEEWKRCLGLVLQCAEIVQRQQAFFVKALRLLRLQLHRSADVEGGLFDLGADNGDLLRNWLVQFRRTLDQQFPAKNDGKVLKQSMVELESTFQDMFSWQLDNNYVHRGQVELEDGETVELEMPPDQDDEQGEYAPEVVDLEVQTYS